MEYKVYAVNWDKTLYGSAFSEYTDKEFINEAERQGLVWSLEGFVEAFNDEMLSTHTHSIKILLN